ncbi:hypothetical protein NQI61_003083 [Salmonella enterica]|nr:hypothetical protein [Salmonella enterica]
MEKQYPSEQYLKELLSNTEFARAAPVEVVRCMAKELLKYREAKPVAWVTTREGDNSFPRLHKEESQADYWVDYCNVGPEIKKHALVIKS